MVVTGRTMAKPRYCSGMNGFWRISRARERLPLPKGSELTGDLPQPITEQAVLREPHIFSGFPGKMPVGHWFAAESVLICASSKRHTFPFFTENCAQCRSKTPKNLKNLTSKVTV